MEHEFSRQKSDNPIEDVRMALEALVATGVDTIVMMAVAGNGVAYSLVYGNKAKEAVKRLDAMVNQESSIIRL